MMTNHPRRKNAPRGFAILIILAVIATASVIIATQLASTEGQDGARIRTTESLAAREAAERCVEIADALVEATGNAARREDFDRLLDPDGTIDNTGSGDDFLPPTDLIPSVTGVTKFIPPTQSTAAYAYRAYKLSNTSACFVRFDDNYDDANGNLPTDLDDVGVEGLFVNVPQRDRDRTIIITSIGMTFVAGVSLDNAYEKAHAVATVKRLRAMPINIADGLAIHAGGNVEIDRGQICGDIGGIIADSIEGDSLCVCGVLDADTGGGGVSQGDDDSPCPTCTDCASNEGSDTSTGPRPDPTINVPSRPAFMANEAFGKPNSSGNDIAAGACLIYTRDDDATLSGANPIGVDGSGNPLDLAAQVFVWDKNDSDLDATKTSFQTVLGAGTITGAGQLTGSCTSNTSDPVPKPCTWQVDPTTKEPVSIDCAAGESLCWKLVAHLGDGDGITDFDIQNRGRNEQASTTGSAKGSHFTPKTGGLPNLANTASGTAVTWNSLCGGCNTCNGTENTIAIDGDDLRLSKSGTALTQENFPSPAILIFETRAPDATSDGAAVSTPELKIAIGAITTGSSNIPRLRVITNGGVSLEGSTKLCDPDSTCPEANLKAITQGAECASTDADVQKIEGEGFAIIAGGNMRTQSRSFGIVGRIDVGTLDADNNDCFIGSIVAHDPAPGVFDCDVEGSSFCATASTVCFKNTFNLTGDVFAHGNICMKNNASFDGTIASESNIAWKNNGAIDGQVKALGDITGKNNNTVTFGSDEKQSFVGTDSEMWMESSW